MLQSQFDCSFCARGWSGLTFRSQVDCTISTPNCLTIG